MVIRKGHRALARVRYMRNISANPRPEVPPTVSPQPLKHYSLGRILPWKGCASRCIALIAIKKYSCPARESIRLNHLAKRNPEISGAIRNNVTTHK